ncbi:glycosyltransferase family 2 protein [Capnocytophaga stomatis]|uniref:Glycosyltransferase family 2 protein n=1 Tax=Capnocytophaga stomatis TaxID=1848904 RepID=A0ABW8Q9V7_9FLAO|nr:glycosyltransferase family 2 protein [Capnocytophaga stomatis]GIJ93034.1 glycosyl transferase family 2 [Capnocytophaga stomatis]GIJ96258.1 glycosyl transferase family 2 [Capnocytophaga stomatis]
MQISIVIPLLNEEESLTELHNWIVQVMKEHKFTYQIIFVDDGSTDDSWKIIKELSQKDSCVSGIRFFRNYGKSQALHIGFAQAEGDVIITMDADLQDSPDEIPALYRMITTEGYDLVSGWKKKRYDSKIAKNLPSKLFNWAARKTSGLHLHDFNCGLKAYKKEVVKNIDVSGEMHRYIPVLAKNAGYKKITEKIVQHQARKYGQTKFGMNRFINGFLDLITISFISHFGKRPMHFFGALGVLMFFIGFVFSAYLGIDKLFINPHNRLIASRPEFYIALTTMVIGTQFFIAGFLGEIILRTKNKEERYKISEKIGIENL